MYTRALPAAVFAAALVAVAGCSDGPKIVPISGTVTYKGEKVPSLLVTFQPDKGRPSWGITDKDGRFTLEYDEKNKGAVVGNHTVSASYRPNSPDEEMGKVKPHPATTEVTAKYGDVFKSPYKLEVTRASDSVEIKLD